MWNTELKFPVQSLSIDTEILVQLFDKVQKSKHSLISMAYPLQTKITLTSFDSYSSLKFADMVDAAKKVFRSIL